MLESAPVSPSDVETRWRPLTDDEMVAVSDLIDAAWAILVTQAPAVTAVEDGTVGETLVRHVIVTAVLRVMKNPDGAKTESIDDYSFTRSDDSASGGLYFTDAELALVSGTPPQRSASVSMDSYA